MPLHHALLSLLQAGDSYGYDLKRRFEREVGPQWGALNIGHVYQLLQRLERDGLVMAVRSEARGGRPDRVIYEITGAGRSELKRWLSLPAPSPTGYRDERFLKVLAGAREGQQTLQAVLDRERDAALEEIHALTRLLPAEDALAELLVRGALAQARARMTMMDDAEDRVAELVLVAAARPAQAEPDDVELPAARRQLP
jgi:DNA-binding PadR family transcriptional regulator